MIAEFRDGNPLTRALWKVVGGGTDSLTIFEVPDTLDFRMPIYGDISLNLKGSKDDLNVILESHGRELSVNGLAPQNTRFAVEAGGLQYGRMKTDVDTKTIIIPAGHDHRLAVPYGILHGIGRLEVLSDEKRNRNSIQAHKIVYSSVMQLQAYGRATLSEETSIRNTEMLAWKIVAQEELDTSEYALRVLQSLLSTKHDPIPGISGLETLTKLVNSPDILRTRLQKIVDPNNVGRYIRIPMTLTEEQVGQLVHVNER